MKHYKNTEQITEQVDYEFKLPEFGKSTTDPTYYEPSATRIANMRRSAQSGKSLYDFAPDSVPTKKDSKGRTVPDWEKQDITAARITPGRKPGMTREEISQHMNEAQQNYDDYKNDLKNEKEENLKQINQVKNTLETLKNEADSSAE